MAKKVSLRFQVPIKGSEASSQFWTITKIRNIIFGTFCSHFGAAVAKDIQQIQRDITPKMFLETLSMFSQPELPGKKRD